MSFTRQKIFVAWLSAVSNITLIVLKVAIGLSLGAVSIISEAVHSGVDLVASVITVFAVSTATKPADDEHAFGHGKFENISGSIEAVLIFIAACWIIYEAIKKLVIPYQIEGPGLGIVIMLISAILNFIVSNALSRVGKKSDSVALEAEALHLRTDVYTSAGVMIGLSAIWVGHRFWPAYNVSWIDPLSAIFVAVLIIRAAYDLAIKSGRDLLDMSLPDDEILWIKQMIGSHNAVQGFHNLRTRKAGPQRFIEFDLVLAPNTSLIRAHKLAHEVSAEVQKRFKGAHVLVHTEPCDGTCSKDCIEGCLVKEDSENRAP